MIIGNPIYDRAEEASFFAEFFTSFLGNGVYPNPSTGMQVLANSGLNLKIQPGKCFINGYFGLVEEGGETIAIESADSNYNRIDRIVARWDLELRKIIPFVLKGTPASNPVVPSMTRNSNIYEIALADVAVKANATVITQANITDRRLDTSLCGVVSGVIQQLDTTTLFNQYQTWFREKQQESNEDYQTWFNGFTEPSEKQFIEWFEGIKNRLGEDVATNLQVQLDEIKKESVIVSKIEPQLDRRKVWLQKGKNLFDGKYNTGFGYSQTAGEQIVLANVYSNKNIMSIPLNATKICLSKNGVGISARFFFYDSDKNFITSIAVFDPPYIIDIPQNARYCNCQTGKDNTNNEFINIQIETGIDDSTLPTTFEEYITPSIYVKNDDGTYEKIIEQTYLSREEHDEDMKHKVDKIEGKVLSTNDFTNAYKTKLDGIEPEANKIITKTATTKTHTNNPNDNTKVPNMGFLSYWNGAYNASNTSNITYCYEGEIQAKPTILYDNASGSNGTITLSQTAGNFKFLRICYLRDSSTATEKEYASVVVYWPNNKNVGLYVNHATGNVFQMYGTRIKIYGTSITHVQGDMLAINKTVGIVNYETNNHLKIVSVLGYK